MAETDRLERIKTGVPINVRRPESDVVALSVYAGGKQANMRMECTDDSAYVRTLYVVRTDQDEDDGSW